MKIALVHDDFMQWGGAERVVHAMMELYPDAPVYTLAYQDTVLPEEFDTRRLRTTFFQKRFFKRFFNILFFLHPIVFERFNLNEYDVVISSSTRFAKSVITQPHTKHIAYINSPPRFLWPVSQGFGPRHYIDNFVSKTLFLFRPFIWLFLRPKLTVLRMHDFSAVQRIDYLIGNSQNVVNRINKFYRKDASVIYPFADLSRFLSVPISEEKGEYFLVVSRLSSHKRVDLVVEACSSLGLPLKVIGTGPEREALEKLAGDTVEFLGYRTDEEVVEYMKKCRAFMYPQEEDFGITAIEAQALGKPVIAFRKGGAMETVKEGKTGIFFDEQTIESLGEAVKIFEQQEFDHASIREHAKAFSKERFEKELSEFVLKVSTTP